MWTGDTGGSNPTPSCLVGIQAVVGYTSSWLIGIQAVCTRGIHSKLGCTPSGLVGMQSIVGYTSSGLVGIPVNSWVYSV